MKGPKAWNFTKLRDYLGEEHLAQCGTLESFPSHTSAQLPCSVLSLGRNPKYLST